MDARTLHLGPALLALGLASGLLPGAQASAPVTSVTGVHVEQVEREQRQAVTIDGRGIGAAHASTSQGRYGTLISTPAAGPAASTAADPSQQSTFHDGLALFWAAREPGGGHRHSGVFPPAPDLVLCAGLTSGYYALARFTCRHGGIESAAFRGCGFAGMSVVCAAP